MDLTISESSSPFLTQVSDLTVSHVPVPHTYVVANWPLQRSAISASGTDIAVAGRNGLAVYNRPTERCVVGRARRHLTLTVRWWSSCSPSLRRPVTSLPPSRCSLPIDALSCLRDFFNELHYLMLQMAVVWGHQPGASSQLSGARVAQLRCFGSMLWTRPLRLPLAVCAADWRTRGRQRWGRRGGRYHWQRVASTSPIPLRSDIPTCQVRWGDSGRKLYMRLQRLS